MNTIYLIRHGMTNGNKLRRYIGRTDEPLCDEKSVQKPNFSSHIDSVFVSPYIRCRRTAEIMFPEKPQTVIDNLRECDFGIFENKSADELKDCEEYSSWLETGCMGSVPNGENVAEFKLRCCKAFQQCIDSLKPDTDAAFVIHGGSIMAILEKFAQPKKSFYEYHVKNCGFFKCRINGKNIEIMSE